MRAVGKSMEPEIHEGDLLLIRQQTAYQPNDKVLIIHETKPKIKLIKETPNGHFLISLNQSFDDVLIQKDHNTQIV